MFAEPRTVYVALCLLAGATSAGVTVVTLGRPGSHTRTRRYCLAGVSLAGAVWATAYGLQFAAGDVPAKRVLTSLTWLAALALPTCWLAFVLTFTGRDRLVRGPAALLLLVEPAVMLGVTATNDTHGLLVAGSGLERVAGTAVLVTAYGPAFYVHLLYAGSVTAAGLALLGGVFLRSEGLYRRQITLLFVPGVVPGVMTGIWLSGVGRAPAVNPTPMLFTLTNGAILVALLRYRLLDVAPVATANTFEQLRDGIVVVDGRGRVVDANEAAGAVLVGEGPYVGREAAAIVPDPALAVLDGERSRGEVTARDDRVFEVSASGTTGPSGDGTVLVFRDVTQRRRKEEGHRALVENAHDLVEVFDENRVRTYCSPAVERILGHDPESLVGTRAGELVHPDDREAVEAWFADVLDGEGTHRQEYRFRAADGSWRSFESVAVDMRDNPAVGGVVVNGRDVTDRRRYRQRLSVLDRVLRHDLRNDMNVVAGYADVLRDRVDDPEAAAMAGTIRERALDLHSLAEQTRNLDRTLDSHGASPTEIVAPTERVVDDARESHPAATVRLSAPSAAAGLVSEGFEEALRNLVENGIEHNDRPEPTVEVAVRRSAGCVVVSVADDGPGIPDAERDVVLAGDETPLDHGSGLGLWVVSWIVEASEGELSFAANDPRGTVVTMCFEAANDGRTADGAGDAEAGSDGTGETTSDSDDRERGGSAETADVTPAGDSPAVGR